MSRQLLWRRRFGHAVGRLIKTGSRQLTSRPPECLRGDTISKLGNAHDWRVSSTDKLIKSRQLVSSQSESILDNLLVQLSLEFEDDLADSNTRSPVIETTLSLSHTRLVSGSVDTNVCRDACVEAVLHSTQALTDDIFANFELCSTDATVVIEETETVVAPDDGGAAGAASSGYARSSFAILLVGTGTGKKPGLSRRCGRECAREGREDWRCLARVELWPCWSWV
jgi:hypothetical protein